MALETNKERKNRYMLLTITYEGEHTQDLGYLLYKNPDRAQEFELILFTF